MVHFGERMKKLRLDKGLTQAQLAKKLSVSKSVVSAYETSLRMPSYDVLLKMAKEFSTSTDYLLGLGDRFSDDRVDLSGLTQEEKRCLRELVKAMKHKRRRE